MKIFIVNGAPGSGKTTFESIIYEKLGHKNVAILSTINFVKDVATYCGWDGSKTLENRKFLSDLKILLSNWNDIPFQNIKSLIAMYKIRSPKSVIFIDSREPEEITRLCKEFNAQSVLVHRESAEQQKTSNTADANVLKYNYDIIVPNNGSISDLEKTADYFIHTYIQ